MSRDCTMELCSVMQCCSCIFAIFLFFLFNLLRYHVVWWIKIHIHGPHTVTRLSAVDIFRDVQLISHYQWAERGYKTAATARQWEATRGAPCLEWALISTQQTTWHAHRHNPLRLDQSMPAVNNWGPQRLSLTSHSAGQHWKNRSVSDI